MFKKKYTYVHKLHMSKLNTITYLEIPHASEKKSEIIQKEKYFL